jgi:predicted phage tail protein
MYKLILSKPLQKFTNNVREVSIDGDSYYNLYSNLTNLFPDLKRTTDELKFNKYGDIWFLVDGKILSMEKIFLQPKKNVDIVIVPIIAGSGEDGLMIAVGVALIAVSLVLMQPHIAAAIAVGMSGLSAGAAVGASLAVTAGLMATSATITTIAGFALSMGIGMVLSGVLAATAPKGQKSTASDTNSRRNNDSFEGLDNTTSTQTAIPLIYGHHRVPGQFISGKIRTINHDRSTFVSVANYI